MPAAPRRLAPPLIALALAGLAACGGGTVTTQPSAPPSSITSGGVVVPSVSVPPVVVPSIGSSSQPDQTSSAGAAALPAGFPLPPGATVIGSTDDGHEIAAQISGLDGSAAASFWQGALPAAGYTVNSVDGAGGFTEIRLSGHGFAGDSQIAVTGSTAALQLDRG